MRPRPARQRSISGSALAVAGSLIILGSLVWFLTGGREVAMLPTAPTAPSTTTVVTPSIAPAPDAVAARETRPASADTRPRISNRAELAAVLTARGLDAEKLIASYQDWRVSHGYLGTDDLTLAAGQAVPAEAYTAMDRSTQKALADSGDLGAIQAYAASSRARDPFTALDFYARASKSGSAAAMGEVASIYADQPIELRNANPQRDLRQDALAWTLASIRQYGPAVATPGGLALAEDLARSADNTLLIASCGQSLAILADLSAATAGKDNGAMPPVFLAEKNLYDRLPCRDTPAPVTPPRALEVCTSSPAIDSGGRPVELWICPGN